MVIVPPDDTPPHPGDSSFLRNLTVCTTLNPVYPDNISFLFAGSDSGGPRLKSVAAAAIVTSLGVS
jgi:hypothetical protein